MFVKMMKPNGNRVHNILAKEQKIYEQKGWRLAEKKTEKKVRKKKVEVIEEPIVETNDEQLDLDLNEENE